MANINNGVLDGVRQLGARFRDLAISGGLPGAPLGFRLRGATQSGAPVTGTWRAGDEVRDRSNGSIYICTASGTGLAATWVIAGGTQAAAVYVSPFGVATSGVTLANNGAQYGPDTPGTVTCGIQEAVNYAVAQALAANGTAPLVQLLGGKFTLSAFTNTTYRMAIAIDSGFDAAHHAPVPVTIRGAANTMNSPEGTSFAPTLNPGATVIDASALDVLAQGLYKQGRVFGVVPRLANGTGLINAPLNAVDLRVEDLAVIVPVYNAAGTGSPAYSLSGTSMQLFVSGNSQSSNTTHYEFVNGIDAFAASSFKVKNVTVLSGLAAWNATGNQYAGAGGVFSYGSAAGFVFPHESNQGNVYFESIATYDLHTSAMISTHTSGDQLYSQASQHVLYHRSSGHGARIGRMNPQSCNHLIRHLIMAQLTNSLAGAFFDPVGDLYSPIGLTFPTSASTSVLHIAEASVEAAMNTFLQDDPSNPLTVVAYADYTGTVAIGNWGSGANLIVNLADIASHSQTTLAGTTAGSVVWTLTGNTPWDKRFVAYLNGYSNTTATAQTVTFPIAYNTVPAVVKDATGASTATATVLTLPASMGAPVTGYVILEGY